ncbi:MAG: D-glycerate dehydrogenase [Ignavibacteria bacterium]|jgi:glyoxylate reductase|nr:D-glycerate dehydrogenase [Ignavibacteria bacterium]MDH7526948.1 D-glycerate dehydrogenase [Ignavibacteria bacterium]
MKVFVTAIVPEIAINILRENGITVIENKSYLPLEPKTLIKKAKECDGLLCLLANKINKEIIDGLPKLKVIANYAVGFNNIDVEYATQKKIWVTNTPDVLTNATADLAFALLLACARRIVEADEFTRKGKFKIWQSDLMLGKELNGHTVGIIGAGRIGQAFGRRAKGFGMKILYYDKKRIPDFEKETGAKFSSLNQLLKKSDFISLHTPLTKETYHLIDKEEFELMKDGAILINTARGEVINEKELVNALKSNKLFAAGLDVYEFEPKITKDLLKMKNVVLLPHIGSATYETRNKMAELAAKNIVNVLKGKKPITPVNKI